MIDEGPKKGRRGPPRRNPACYQTLRDITIPAGTILRFYDADHVSTMIGFGPEFSGELVVEKCLDATMSGYFKQVIA